MRSTVSFVAAIGAALGGAAIVTVVTAAPAAAEPTSNLPDCTSTAGGTYTGTGITRCETPGNVQIAATAPQPPAYIYPWDDEFYGPALIIGGGGFGPHGGGHGGR